MASAETSATTESAFAILWHLRAMVILHDCVDEVFETYVSDIATETDLDLQTVISTLDALFPLELVIKNEDGSCSINARMLHRYRVNQLAFLFQEPQTYETNPTIEEYFASGAEGPWRKK